MTAALEAGAEDFSDEGDAWQILTAPADLIPVRDALKEASYQIDSARITMLPLNTVEVEGKDAERALSLIDTLDDHDDVQNVYANLDVSEATLAAMEG